MEQNREPDMVKRREAIEYVAALKVPKAFKPFQGFLDFIRGYGVVTIAIGLFLGADLKSIVDSLTVNIINPLIGTIFNAQSLNTQNICLNTINGVCKSSLNYGTVIGSIISFVIAAFVVYLIIKVLRLDKFEKKKQ